MQATSHRNAAEFAAFQRAFHQLLNDQPTIHPAAFFDIVYFELMPQHVPQNRRPALVRSSAWDEFIDLWQRLGGRKGGRPKEHLVTHTQRWPRGLHNMLQAAASRRGVSLNQLVAELCAGGITTYIRKGSHAHAR